MTYWRRKVSSSWIIERHRSYGRGELYHLLVVESGWTGDSYEEWLTDALAMLLLR